MRRFCALRVLLAAASAMLCSAPAGAQLCPGPGDCCTENGSAGCDDLACCLEVCQNDPFCCDVQWDSLCASIAESTCAVCGAGCPGVGNCCGEKLTPSCENTICCLQVCASDPYCCDTVWDATCALAANALCAICQIPPCVGGGGDCCVNNGTPGCEDFDCCDVVCATDAFCCDSSWDNICANRAVELCPQCEFVLGDLDGDGAVGQGDLFALFGDWGECFDCNDCPSDLDGDCEAGILDLFIVFANWD